MWIGVTLAQYDNLNIELGRKIGGLDTKVEIGLADLQEQVNRVEGKIDQLGEQVAYLVRMQQEKRWLNVSHLFTRIPVGEKVALKNQ